MDEHSWIIATSSVLVTAKCARIDVKEGAIAYLLFLLLCNLLLGLCSWIHQVTLEVIIVHNKAID